MIDGIDGKLVYEIIRDLVLVLFFTWMVLNRRSQASKDSVADLKTEHDKRLFRHGDRLTKIETILEGMPSHDDINLLHTRVGAVKDTVGNISSSVAGVVEAVKGLKRGVDLLTKHHISNHKGDE